MFQFVASLAGHATGGLAAREHDEVAEQVLQVEGIEGEASKLHSTCARCRLDDPLRTQELG